MAKFKKTFGSDDLETVQCLLSDDVRWITP